MSKLSAILHESFHDLINRDYTQEQLNREAGLKKMNQKKKRGCLKCGVSFLSDSYGNRTCGSCAAQNKRVPANAQYSI